MTDWTDRTGPDRTDSTAHHVAPGTYGQPASPDRTSANSAQSGGGHKPDRSDAERADRSAEIADVMTGPRHLLRAFYGIVLSVALIGQTAAAKNWLHWPLLAAAAAVVALEVGGVAVSVYADARRRLGERALIARLVSAGLAAFAVTVNWQGHLGPKGSPTLQASFFAGFSLVGYVVWLVDTSARRRDSLRIAGDLAAVPPAYEVGLWLRHPMITSRARELGKSCPGLGRTLSWQMARDEIRQEQRNKHLAAALQELVAKSADKRMASIATLTYDLDQVAGLLADLADYEGLAGILAAQLTADRLVGAAVDRTGRKRRSKQSDDADQTGPAALDRSNAGATPDRSDSPVQRTAASRPTLRAVQSGRVTQEDRVAELDRIYPDEIPSRAKVMARTGWTSVSETGKAIKALRGQRGQSSPDQTDDADDDQEHAS